MGLAASWAHLDAQVSLEDVFSPELGRRPGEHDLAAVHEIHRVREVECTRDVLLDDQQGRAARVDPLQRLEDQLAEVQDVDVVADLADQSHVVLDQQDPQPAIGHRGGEDLSEAPGFGAVEA